MQNRILKAIFPVTGDKPLATNVPDALKYITEGRLMTSVEKKLYGLQRSLSDLDDEVFDIVMHRHEKRIRAWVEKYPAFDE